MSFWRFSSHLGKKGQFSAKKKRNIYGGNGFRNIKKMAGINFPIGIGNQTGKIDSKKGPETGIPRNSGGIPAEFPTKSPTVRREHFHPRWRSVVTASIEIFVFAIIVLIVVVVVVSECHVVLLSSVDEDFDVTIDRHREW